MKSSPREKEREREEEGYGGTISRIRAIGEITREKTD